MKELPISSDTWRTCAPVWVIQIDMRGYAGIAPD